MAGTNKINKLISNGPCIILKDPQLPENIGMCARSMLNYGFSDLRIVNPKKAFPNDKAISASAGAFDKIIKKTRVFSNLEEAMKSIKVLFATSVSRLVLAFERGTDLLLVLPLGNTISLSSALRLPYPR